MAATAFILNFDVTGASIDCSKHNEWPTTPLGTRYRTARSGGKLGEVNSAQKQAIRNVFNHCVSLVHGPPGCAKTQTIIFLVAKLLEIAPKSKFHFALRRQLITIAIDDDVEEDYFFVSQMISGRQGSIPGSTGASQPYKLALRFSHARKSSSVKFSVVKGARAELFSFRVWILSSDEQRDGIKEGEIREFQLAEIIDDVLKELEKARTVHLLHVIL
ncbi:hypothetical protein LTS15_000554 [Exophiala xenobiotica]|nr:hypothetical protein LTS15_000554 [Exophiala xenobiotica]